MLMWKLVTSQTWWLWWVLNDKNITLACSYVPHCWSNNRFGSLMITVTVSTIFEQQLVIPLPQSLPRDTNMYTDTDISANLIWQGMHFPMSILQLGTTNTLWCNRPAVNPTFKDGIHINSIIINLVFMVIIIILLKALLIWEMLLLLQ